MSEGFDGSVIIAGVTPTYEVPGHWLGFSRYSDYGNGRREPTHEIVDLAVLGEVEQPVWRNMAHIPAAYLREHQFSGFDFSSNVRWYQRMSLVMESACLDTISPNRQIYCEGTAAIRDGILVLFKIFSSSEPEAFAEDEIVRRFACGVCGKFVERPFVVRKGEGDGEAIATAGNGSRWPTVFHKGCQTKSVHSQDLQNVLVCRLKFWEMSKVDS